MEEWLASDSVLDRPVLVRFLGPETSPERRRRFLEAVRAAAGASHIHLAAVYTAGELDGSAFSVVEWTGGVTIADRVRAGSAIETADFLPNAAGLAAGLASLHATGCTHGAIDAAAVSFAAAHPAKLGSFGRVAAPGGAGADTRALALVLRQGITGTALPLLPPSDVAPGLPRDVDGILDLAEGGDLDASGLAAALQAVPSVPAERAAGEWSWRWLTATGILLAAALLVALLGLGIAADPGSPLLFPVTPPASTVPAAPSTTVAPATTAAGVAVELGYSAAVFDPFGDGVERDEDLGLIRDDDAATAWRTERYYTPLASLKAGVDLVFTVAGTPGAIEIRATPDTRFSIGWAGATPDDFSDWEITGSGAVVGPPARLQVPERTGGVWLLWLTDLPRQGDDYYSEIWEVRFWR